VVAVKIAVTAAFALASLWFSSDSARFMVALAATGVVGCYAVRDLLYPVRLTAGPRGVGVSRGLIGLRHIEWGEIVRIRVDERRRFGAVTSLLEIDIDSTLYLFSRHEIGDDPVETAQLLRDWRARALASGPQQ
jgi:hypothetical protein